MYFVFRLNEDDPIWLIILFTHHVCLPSANTTWVFIQHHQFHYCFNIPVVDLTADIILTKLESLVKWICLIPFLTEMLKNHLPALRSLFFAILIIQLSSKLVSLSPSEIFPFPFLLIFIGTLLCKVVLVSGVQQSKSVVCVCVGGCVCISPLFWISLSFRSTEDWLEFLVKVAQSCPTLYDPMDYIVHGILQARILEWVTFPFSRGSSQPRNWTQDSRSAGRFFTSWATREVLHLQWWP